MESLRSHVISGYRPIGLQAKSAISLFLSIYGRIVHEIEQYYGGVVETKQVY